MDHDARLDADAFTAQVAAAEKAVSAWLRRRGCRSLDEEYAALPALLAEVPNALDSQTVRGYLKVARDNPGNPFVPVAAQDLASRIYGRRPGAPGSSWERAVDRQQYESYRRWRKLFDEGRRATRGAATVAETLGILRRQKIGDKLRVQSRSGRSSNPAQRFLAESLFRFEDQSAKEIAALTILGFRRRTEAERRGKNPVPVTAADTEEAVQLIDRLRPRNRKTEKTTPS